MTSSGVHAFTHVFGNGRGRTNNNLLLAPALSEEANALASDFASRPALALSELYTHRALHGLVSTHPALAHLRRTLCETTVEARAHEFTLTATPLLDMLGLPTQELPTDLWRVRLQGSVTGALFVEFINELARDHYLDVAAFYALTDKLYAQEFPHAAANALHSQGITTLAARYLAADTFYIPLTPFASEIEKVLLTALARDEDGSPLLEASTPVRARWQRGISKLLCRKYSRGSQAFRTRYGALA
jgi:hypothetical protein